MSLYDSQDNTPLLEVKDLRKWFKLRKGFLSKLRYVKAVDGISFSLEMGKTLGIVGESGCGKSTLARLLMHLIEIDGGQININGRDIAGIRGKTLKNFRKNMQMIFQDSYASLNPRMRVGNIIAEPLLIHGESSAKKRKERVEEMLEIVGLSKRSFYKFPHEFSGGQRQRIDIARALIFHPQVVICDEAVSALDVSVQSQILNLLKELQERLDLTYIFISHDLSVVRHISDEILVMYLGKTVEKAEKNIFFKEPLHPYSQTLLSATPQPDPDKKSQQIILSGEVPSPINPPSGCHFHPRCPVADESCRITEPTLKEVFSGRFASCLKLYEGKKVPLMTGADT
ncbi:dipeptide ABC transporter ATP-binding protein [bacterium]|nr:dipeptide ABC transporter ATP-binding protein [bacterium]